MKKLTTLLVATFLFVSSIFAAPNVQLSVKLKNGDIVTGTTNLPKINIVTPYGSLSVPIEKISNLSLGIVSDHTKDGAVLPDLNKLQTVSETEAKAIYERLLNYGAPILSTVITFTQNPFYKISDNENYTIEQLVDALYAKAGLSSADNINDAITFENNNYLEGSIAFSDVTLQSEYGILTLKRDKIQSLDISPIEEAVGGNGNYKLKANYHISGNDNKGWVNTGVKVKTGDNISITSNGKVVLKSLSGGVYNPDGYVSGTKDGAYSDDAEIKYGTVVYKIGEYGDMKLAGSKLDAVADGEGTIYISIYESVYDKGNTGSYTVKVLKK